MIREGSALQTVRREGLSSNVYLTVFLSFLSMAPGVLEIFMNWPRESNG